jgi:GNAT superfamily N-acetyltransferase
MSTKATEQGAVLKDLGDGLVLRRGRDEDAEPLAEFNAVVNSVTEDRDEEVYYWTLDMMSGELPNFDASDFTVVEDERTGAIVSTLNLISQTWSYDGVEFAAGRIELVGTDPDYRRRGLVRAQMEVVHEWSARRGEKVLGITGIPWYYRQFGYELALDHLGGRAGYKANVPRLKDGDTERYSFRKATVDDIPFLSRVYEQGNRRFLVSCVRDEEMWRHELLSRSKGSPHRLAIRVIETAAATPVGLLVHTPRLGGGEMSASVYELLPGVPWLDVTPSVVRYLEKVGLVYAARDGRQAFAGYSLSLGTEHPAYDAGGDLLPRASRPYSWWVRVPDVADFVRHVAPVLERRLWDSLGAGYTGELKINFVGDGLQMAFEKGRLTEAARWIPTQLDSRLGARERDALFPALTFLKLLFGFRDLDDLEHAHPDLLVSSSRVRELLKALFPRKVSRIWGIE